MFSNYFLFSFLHSVIVAALCLHAVVIFANLMYLYLDAYFGILTCMFVSYFCNRVLCQIFTQSIFLIVLYEFINFYCIFLLLFIFFVCVFFVYVFCFCFVWLAVNRSESPPGGNQVDGLPPALRCMARRAVRVKPAARCFDQFDSQSCYL